MRYPTIIAFATALLTLFSCQQRYQMTLDLAVSRNEIKLPAAEGQTYLIVYSTSPWRLEGTSPWVTLSEGSGDAQTQVNIVYGANTGLSREAEFTLSGSGRSIPIKISQEGLSADSYAFNFGTASITALNAAAAFSASLETDIPGESLTGLRSTVLYAGEEDPWIEDLSFEGSTLRFKVTENTGGIDRTATITASVPVAYWDTAPQATLWITQRAGSIILGPVPESLELDPEGVQKLTFTLEPPYSREEFDYTITYRLDPVPEWLEDIAFDGLTFSARPRVNYGAPREAALTFTLVREGEVADTKTIRLVQGHTAQGVSGADTGEEVDKDDEQTF